jgi:hypothetical protein
VYSAISPADWGLSANREPLPFLDKLGLDPAKLEWRAHECTYQWLLGQFDEAVGAFHGYFCALDNSFAPPQNVNLIAPFQLLAAFDRYGDAHLLERATRATDWLEANLVESHPMSLVCGGVRDNLKPAELWVKYTADYVMLNLGVWRRSQEPRFRRRALQSARFLIQAQHHGFATQNDEYWGRWETDGWQSFGRVVEAFLDLHEATGDGEYLGNAVAWGEHGLSLLQPDGCLYLVHEGEYYNSDLAADEIRALAYLSGVTGRTEFLYGSRAFADWHVRTQRPDGAWILNVDRHGHVVSDYVGPGDPPNIGIGLLLMHKLTGEVGYLVSALKGLHYALTRQVVPGSSHLYADNSRTHWGLWSWDPHYDYTMSGDQATHLVRGIWFTLDYLATLDPAACEALSTAGLSLPPLQ